MLVTMAPNPLPFLPPRKAEEVLAGQPAAHNQDRPQGRVSEERKGLANPQHTQMYTLGAQHILAKT